jgi:hypothetical protein
VSKTNLTAADLRSALSTAKGTLDAAMQAHFEQRTDASRATCVAAETAHEEAAIALSMATRPERT